MPRTIISVLVILLLGGALVMFALRGCESPSEPPVDTIQYENTHEETTEPTTPERSVVQYSNERIQYPSELPPTGGVRLW